MIILQAAIRLHNGSFVTEGMGMYIAHGHQPRSPFVPFHPAPKCHMGLVVPTRTVEAGPRGWVQVVGPECRQEMPNDLAKLADLFVCAHAGFACILSSYPMKNP